MTHEDVMTFWFSELEPKQWWVKDLALDEQIKHRFGAVHHQAHAGELAFWRNTARGSLAEVIVLDQFSRNIFRDAPESFASDPLALALAQTAISKGFDRELTQTECGFLYMPFMHSESPLVHLEAVKLIQQLDSPGQLDFEYKHKAIIDKFGRYPHRNTILGRTSTEEELAFLQQPNSSF